MWDFELGRTFALIGRTAPFIVLRLAVYLGIALAYGLGTGTGAGIGYGVTAFGQEPGGGAVPGAFIGFLAVTGVLYWLREYILYLVKAGHIAVLVELLEGRPLPEGRGQIDYAQRKVRERFAEASVLFGLDQLIKGILRAINGVLFTVAAFLPIPGLEGLVRFVNQILNLSLTYTDEIILAYNLRIGSQNPWETSKDALILYAQSYKIMLKNAFFLMLIMYGLTLLIFLLLLAPVGALMALFPGSVGAGTFIGALILAWSLKAAILEPFAIAALMPVYFRAIEGQTPNPEWDAKLSQLSEKFRQLKTQAVSFVKSDGSPTATPPPASAS